jgi:hypothetical protein
VSLKRVDGLVHRESMLVDDMLAPEIPLCQAVVRHPPLMGI